MVDISLFIQYISIYLNINELGIVMKEKRKAIASKYCTACGCCLKVCPVGALCIEKGVRAVPDHSQCVGCGKCEETCPASAITVEIKEGVE